MMRLVVVAYPKGLSPNRVHDDPTQLVVMPIARIDVNPSTTLSKTRRHGSSRES